MSGRLIREARALAGYLPLAAVFALTRPLPWAARLAVAGWLGRLAVTRIGKLRARVEANLAHVMPETTREERRRILEACGDTFGRTAFELFHGPDFCARRLWNEPQGAGVAVVRQAIREGKGAIIVSGHFGQWEAGRAWMRSLGAPCAGVYRPMRNRRINARYLASLSHTGSPMLAKNVLAVRGLLGQLARGGLVALLVDQYERRGPRLDFLGRPAPTTLVAAQLALKLGVPLIPGFCARAPDGVRVDIRLEAPVPHTTAREMMQAVNDALAAEVRARPGQYFWLHRRWEKALPGLAQPPGGDENGTRPDRAGGGPAPGTTAGAPPSGSARSASPGR